MFLKSINKVVFILIILSAFSLQSNRVKAQGKVLLSDSSKVIVKRKTIFSDSSKWKYPSPRMAGLLSMAVPGAGQAYNKKFWKMPVVYAGLGTCFYFALLNNDYFQQYKRSYILATDTIPDNENSVYSADQLFILQDKSHRQRDLFIVIATLFYAANIIDAVVDAHLKDFDVSDNLSLNVHPYFKPDQYKQQSFQTGLTLSLKFK